MPIEKEILQAKLEEAFPGAEIALNDLAGDNDHWQASVKSDLFKGKTRIAQHRMVFDAVKEYNIHALSIKTSI